LDYRFTLFSLCHRVDGYPVYFLPYMKIAQELELPMINIGRPISQQAIKADDPASVIDALANILGSNTTKNILQTLIAQARTFKR
jgi:hypothetical protein